MLVSNRSCNIVFLHIEIRAHSRLPSYSKNASAEHLFELINLCLLIERIPIFNQSRNPMSRLPIPSRDEAPVKSQPMLDVVGAQLGVILNLFRLVGQSPAALEGYLGLMGALNKTLDVKTRERIALAVAQVNGCGYCLSAHSYLGANVAKLDEAELAANRRGHSSDPKADTVVVFARRRRSRCVSVRRL